MQCKTCVISALLFLLAGISSRSQPKPIGDTVAVKEVEQAMGSAMMAGDVNKLKQIYAADFAAIGSDGKLFTQEAVS
jgi:hypothetical protein